MRCSEPVQLKSGFFPNPYSSRNRHVADPALAATLIMAALRPIGPELPSSRRSIVRACPAQRWPRINNGFHSGDGELERGLHGAH